MTRLDPAWLDRMYNNRALVPDNAAYLSRWAGASAQARSGQPCTLDIAFGESSAETLDVFPSTDPDAPVLVFIVFVLPCRR